MDKKQISEANSKELKECFIITPIGSVDSDVFKKTEGLINSVLRPVLLDHGFKPIPAHHIDSGGSINKQIIEKIVNSELVIANLTGINPNVMYELAIRHSFGKKVIIVAEHGTKLPFDIFDQRAIFYHDSMHGAENFKPNLSKAIKKCIDESVDKQNVSNPVFDAIKTLAEINNLPTGDRDAIEIILSKLETFERINRPTRTNNYVEFCIKAKDIHKIFPEFGNIFSNSMIEYYQKSSYHEDNVVFFIVNNMGEQFVKYLYEEFKNIDGVISVTTRFLD